MRLLTTIACLCGVALCAVAAAGAHKGLFFTDALRELAVPDGTTSYAAYGRLDSRRTSAAVTVRLRAGERLHVELLLPDRPSERALPRARWPRMRIGWRGGAASVEPLQPPGRFGEPFTRTRYLRVALLDRLAPVGGDYRIEVHGTAGRFVIAPGFVERFGPGDLLRTPEVIRRVRAWYRTP